MSFVYVIKKMKMIKKISEIPLGIDNIERDFTVIMMGSEFL